MSKTDPAQHRSALIVFALALGVVVSLGERALFAAALDREIDLSEIDVLTMNMVLVAIPFLALALQSSKRLAPWAFALVATGSLRWWWLAKGIAYQRAPDGSGVDMFGALLMLLSPFAITAVALAMDRNLQRRAKGS